MTKWLASRGLKARRYKSPEICRNDSDDFFLMIGLETVVLDRCDGAPRLFAAVEKTVAAYTGGRRTNLFGD